MTDGVPHIPPPCGTEILFMKHIFFIRSARLQRRALRLYRRPAGMQGRALRPETSGSECGICARCMDTKKASGGVLPCRRLSVSGVIV